MVRMNNARESSAFDRESASRGFQGSECAELRARQEGAARRLHLPS